MFKLLTTKEGLTKEINDLCGVDRMPCKSLEIEVDEEQLEHIDPSIGSRHTTIKTSSLWGSESFKRLIDLPVSKLQEIYRKLALAKKESGF